MRQSRKRGLEEILDKVLVISDIHVPFQDDRAVGAMHAYSKKYKPDKIYINGDLIDFYKLSTFDQTPDRTDGIDFEITQAKMFLNNLRKNNKDAKIVYLQGNHENRLQRYLWRNPELHGLSALDTKNLFSLKDLDIQEIKVDRDYWSKSAGSAKQGDAIVMHGDSRLNGAKGGGYSGYAAKNTMLNGISSSVVMGHTHRGGVVYHTVSDKILIGVEGGCLCQLPPNANWQQGFVTFETERGKNYNYRFHHIKDGKLIEDGKVYSATKPKKKK
jgi:predicted phosphodiesterase